MKRISHNEGLPITSCIWRCSWRAAIKTASFVRRISSRHFVSVASSSYEQILHLGASVEQLFDCLVQGRNEVWWRPGHKAALAPLCSYLRYFGSKCTVLKKIPTMLLGLFGASRSHLAPPAVIRRPHTDSAPGELCPLAPLVTPLVSSSRNVRPCVP